MLDCLSIKNFALIEDLTLEFSAGLNVITGETGAGKTIVVDALGLVLGDKASAGSLRKGASRLTVAAEFGPPSPRVETFLREAGLLSDDGVRGDALVARREVDANGRSRCFVNDRPVNLATLARLGEMLIYVHGQHEHQLLLKAAEQIELLDTFGHLEIYRRAATEAYARWRDIVSEQQATALSEQERAQRIDLYRFQRQELEAARLKSEVEEEELERLLPQLKNAERLKTLSQEAYGLLYGNEGSALDNVRRVQRDLEALEGFGADLTDVREMTGDALVRLEESARSLEAFQGRIELDPERLDEVLSRMDLLAKLKRKYGPTLTDVMAYQRKVEDDLKHLENVEERSRDLSERLAQAAAALNSSCAKLTQSRVAAAKKMAVAVEHEFRDVGLLRAAFDAAVEKSGQPSAWGADTVSFQFAPNPGEGRKALADVASGGELSRVMLALKSVLAKADLVPALVFDEIDAGVGGSLGGVLGKKLAKLGKSHQVLCITHLAAIAACAQAHFLVEKQVRKDRTATVVRRLSEDDRVPEIARMFGGVDEKNDRSVSVQHARELLAASKG